MHKENQVGATYQPRPIGNIAIKMVHLCAWKKTVPMPSKTPDTWSAAYNRFVKSYVNTV